MVEEVPVKEFDLIQRLAATLPKNASVVTGAGDDCAVLDLGVPGRYVLFKTDAVVQGIHFTESASPEQIGHKALGRCLSDIAAMGGSATVALITLALPPRFDVAFVERIYAGINALAQRYGVAIAGGETTTNPERLLISVSLIGTVERNHCIHRAGARAGDAIFVSGQLGGSLSGRDLDF
jgi:thiamine-monophosphate kinase